MLVVVLVCLATYRSTRLITRDVFPPIAVIRNYITRKFGPLHWVSYLVSCNWCVSVYIGGLITAATWLFSGLPYPFLVWPTAAAVTGMLAQREKVGIDEILNRREQENEGKRK